MADYLAEGAARGIPWIAHLDAGGHTNYWSGAASFVEKHSNVFAVFCCDQLDEGRSYGEPE